MKRLGLLFLLFILTGCSVQYNLDIDKNINLIEDISIHANSDGEYMKIENYVGYLPISIEIDDPSAFEKKLDDIDYYDIKRDNNNTEINFHYDYNVDEVHDNVFARSCYEYVTVMKDDEELILSTSKEFLCFDKYNTLDDVTVTITSKYKLKDTNADIVEKHKYIWNITKSTANNKNLYLLLDVTERDLTFFEKLMEGEYINIFTVSVVLFIVGLIVYWILKRKGERRNEV